MLVNYKKAGALLFSFDNKDIRAYVNECISRKDMSNIISILLKYVDKTYNLEPEETIEIVRRILVIYGYHYLNLSKDSKLRNTGIETKLANPLTKEIIDIDVKGNKLCDKLFKVWYNHITGKTYKDRFDEALKKDEDAKSRLNKVKQLSYYENNFFTSTTNLASLFDAHRLDDLLSQVMFDEDKVYELPYIDGEKKYQKLLELLQK